MKRLLSVICVLALVLLAGCSQGVSKADYEKLESDYKALQAEYAQLKDEYTALSNQSALSGKSADIAAVIAALRDGGYISVYNEESDTVFAYYYFDSTLTDIDNVKRDTPEKYQSVVDGIMKLSSELKSDTLSNYPEISVSINACHSDGTIFIMCKDGETLLS